MDVLTLAEAKNILDISATNTTDDVDLTRLISAVSNRLDQLVGPIVARPVTDEAGDGGSCVIELAHSPVSAVTSVVEHVAGAPTTLDEETAGTVPDQGWFGERYEPDPALYSGMIVRRASGADARFARGRGNIVVTYTAGRYPNIGTVDARFSEAAGLMLRNGWRPYQESVGNVDEFETPTQHFPTFTIPLAVMEMLANEIQPETGFGA